MCRDDCCLTFRVLDIVKLKIVMSMHARWTQTYFLRFEAANVEKSRFDNIGVREH